MDSSSFLLYANWKMHKSPKEARDYIRHITQMVDSKDQKRFVFFAPAFTLPALAEESASSSFGWGAQNCYFGVQGAFPGENSPMVLKEMGATHCLVGHSERRKLFFEDEILIRKKVQALLQYSLRPVICVGENAEERKKGLSFKMVEKQLSGILKELVFPDSVCIAYEPVWAIGSAQPARPDQVFEMQKYVKQLCESEGKKLCFLYGGSVNEKNAKELSQVPGVDGFLVGGASLDPQNFFNLYLCVNS